MARHDQAAHHLAPEQIADMMEESTYTLDDFSLSDVTVEQPADGVAIIGYKVHSEMTVDGKALALDAADTSTWVRQNGRWMCASHTESVLGDPFGRDRAAQGAA
jgi:hypothetical protein